MKLPSFLRSPGVNMQNRIRVGESPFCIAQEHEWLSGCEQDGAVVLFTGKVRTENGEALQTESVVALTLEHYPGMTEKALLDIIADARQRWPLNRVTVIHRTGRLSAGENIVLTGVSAVHRGDAFAAAEFIMDYLKTRAPFWKREVTEQGEQWVEARDSDQRAARRWDQ